MGTLLCAAGKRVYMNKAFGRVALFSEGSKGIQKGQVFALDSNEMSQMTEAFGHNIASSEIMGFWEVLAKICKEAASCTSAEELELFEKVILPMSFKRPQFIVITYAVESDWYAASSHELMHAQYFLDRRFSQIVDRFWNETVTTEDRERIRQMLGEFYNRNDEAVMRNEFQAFLLGTHASQQMLKPFVSVYQDQLIQELKKAGVELLRTKKHLTLGLIFLFLLDTKRVIRGRTMNSPTDFQCLGFFPLLRMTLSCCFYGVIRKSSRLLHYEATTKIHQIAR